MGHLGRVGVHGVIMIMPSMHMHSTRVQTPTRPGHFTGGPARQSGGVIRTLLLMLALSAVLLLGAGLAGLGAMRRRQKKA